MNLIKLFTILCLIPVVMLLKTQKIVYQKDVSEYCRRRVMPSIFLARNAVESTSFILHFSRVELPYSCAISIRTESGCNIIMVSKFNPRAGLAHACAANNPEIMVYEMGETFGGYWGQLSEKVIKLQEPQPKQYYTLKTTQSISTRERVVNITVPESYKTPGTQTTTKKYYAGNELGEEDDDSIKVEVPLVNVYGRFVPDTAKNEQTEDPDAMFDLRFDVTPKPGVVYDTSIIPLVKFNVKKLVPADGRREEDSDEPRFDLDIVEQYTPDKRLTLPHYESTTRLRFKKFRQKMTSNRRRLYFKKNLTKGKSQLPQFTSHIEDYIFPSTKATSETSDVLSKYHWKTIEELMNKVNKTSALIKEKNIKTSTKDAILQKIAEMDHNASIYLKPNLTEYLSSVQSTSLCKKKSSKYTTGHIKIPTKSETLNQNTYTEHSNLSALNSVSTTTRQSVSSKINETSSRTSVKSIVTDTKNKNNLDKIVVTSATQKPTKSLVDHVSWENVVQSARDMAVLLNATDNVKRNIQNDSTNSKDKTYLGDAKSFKRKRREIHAIEIENARPYNLTTRYIAESTTDRKFQLSDMQEFAQLVELQDDDLYGRIALKYIRQYVGPVIFNICEYTNTTKKQHVHLFNASRIVLTINNYTHLTGLSLVMTSARALLSGEPRCPDKNIECQVSGARVCIDPMSACDGVPNCGSYDIYDEDRLMCGASEGLQYNVYIAAFTFLAVLLTVLYAVHYWLKRCVPKVADAFFIYTNGTENILYLQPIMRSPHDAGDEMKLFYHPSLFENDYDHFEAPKKSLFRRFINTLFCGLCIKERKNSADDHSHNTEKSDHLKLDMKNIYSFTQNEIQKMFDVPAGVTAMKAIQSKDSLDVQKKASRRNFLTSLNTEEGSKQPVHDSVLTLEDPFPEDYTDELGMLKFFKDNKKVAADSKSSLGSKTKLPVEETNSIIRTDEKELFNYNYYNANTSEPGPSNVKTEHNHNKNSSRRLRFDEMTTQIPASIIEVDEDEIEENPKEQRHSTFLDSMLGRQRKMEQENESLNNKDHKRLKIGNKKTKKIKQRKNL